MKKLTRIICTSGFGQIEAEENKMKLLTVVLTGILMLGACGSMAEKKGNVKLFNDKYLMVVADSVNVREKPDINSKVVTQLDITYLVDFLSKSDLEYKSKTVSGYWVYIDTGIIDLTVDKNNSIKGWVVSTFLADSGKFKRVNKFKRCLIDGWIGDSKTYYDINTDGSFITKKQDYETDIISTYNGYLYQYGRVVIAVDEIDGKELFYINENNDLCSRHGNYDGTQLCSKDVK